jgi:hypothetical protein
MHRSLFHCFNEVRMKTTQGNMLLSLNAVEAFLEVNAAKLTGVISTGARQKLKDGIANLSTHFTDQTGNALSSQVATKQQEMLRQALLRDHMLPIARIARADLPQTPVIGPLRMPRGTPTIPKLAQAAKGMAQAAAPFSNVFVFNGLPSDFVAQTNAAADALLTARQDRSTNKGQRGAATAGLEQHLTAGRKIVHILDAFVKSALKDDPALLANWNIIKRVQRTGTSSQASTPTPTSSPSPLPTTA